MLQSNLGPNSGFIRHRPDFIDAIVGPMHPRYHDESLIELTKTTTTEVVDFQGDPAHTVRCQVCFNALQFVIDCGQCTYVICAPCAEQQIIHNVLNKQAAVAANPKCLTVAGRVEIFELVCGQCREVMDGHRPKVIHSFQAPNPPNGADVFVINKRDLEHGSLSEERIAQIRGTTPHVETVTHSISPCEMRIGNAMYARYQAANRLEVRQADLDSAREAANKSEATYNALIETINKAQIAMRNDQGMITQIQGFRDEAEKLLEATTKQVSILWPLPTETEFYKVGGKGGVKVALESLKTNPSVPGQVVRWTRYDNIDEVYDDVLLPAGRVEARAPVPEVTDQEEEDKNDERVAQEDDEEEQIDTSSKKKRVKKAAAKKAVSDRPARGRGGKVPKATGALTVRQRIALGARQRSPAFTAGALVRVRSCRPVPHGPSAYLHIGSSSF